MSRQKGKNRSERKDHSENKAKIKALLLKEPTLRQEQICKILGLGKATVSRIVNELENIGTFTTKPEKNILEKIIKNDKEVMELVSGLNVKKIKEVVKKGKVKLYDLKTLNDIAEKSTKRYTLFKGNITDDEGGLKLEASEQKLLNNLLD